MGTEPPWEDEPLQDGAVYKTHGYTRTRVFLVDGGNFVVLAALRGERTDYVHFSELFVGSPGSEKPETSLLEVACVDAPAVSHTRAFGRSKADRSLALRTEAVAPGLKWWEVRLRSNARMWVIAHRWRTRLGGRLVFEIDVESDSGSSSLSSVAITRRAVRSVNELPQHSAD